MADLTRVPYSLKANLDFKIKRLVIHGTEEYGDKCKVIATAIKNLEVQQGIERSKQGPLE